MNKRLLLLGILYILSFGALTAQDARNYAFTTNTNDTLVDMSSGTTQLIGANQTNVSSSVTAIGFEVWFMGTRFTDFSVNANGVFQFGTSQIATGGNTHAIASNYRVTPFVSGTTIGIEPDPITGAFSTASGTGQVHYKEIGTSPNRILVIEWEDMLVNQYSGITNYATYQAHVYETAPPPSNTQGGIIHFVYGSMPSDGRNSSSDTLTLKTRTGIGYGVNDGEHLSVDTRASTPDTTTTDNDVSGVTYVNDLYHGENVPNLHSSSSSARRYFDFEAPDLDGQATTATLQCSGPTQVVLTWAENATNDLGSVIYRSTDGVNFTFLAQTAQGVLDYTDNTVAANTTYYYRFYLVNEGKLSELAGTGQITVTTPSAASIYAVQTGNWNSTSTWSSGAVPTAGDHVVIGCNYTVSITNSGAACNDLTILSGSELDFRDNTDLDINGNLNNSGTFDLNGTTVALTLGGNITNSGTWDPGDATVTLDGTATQAISNSGSSSITTGVRQNVTYTSTDGSDGTGTLGFGVDDNSPVVLGNFNIATGNGTNSAAMTVDIPAGTYNGIANVNFTINHVRNDELEIFLAASGGSQLSDSVYVISSDNGSTSDNYTSVTLTDGAASSITSAAPGDGNPITGSYTPEVTALSDLPDYTSGGITWTLYAIDDASNANTGTMTAFSVTMDSGSTSTTSYSDIAFYNLVINNTNAGGITIDDTMRVVNGLTLTDGVITTAHEVIFFDDATSTVGSNDSYIDGVVRKIGDDAFDFPTGDDGFVGNFAISAPSSTSDEFTAQYFHTDPNASYSVFSLGSGINNVSRAEYWEIGRPVGSSAVTLSASYETTRSQGVTQPTDLLIVHWNGSQWNSEGNGGAHGGGFTGITTSGTISSFSPFTLANTDPNENPLPVSLLDFNATRVEDAARLNWRTASEINSAYFDVERSIDGENFQKIGEEQAAGKSNSLLEYHLMDMEVGGLNQDRVYYRLKMVDQDGSFEYSRIRSVFFDVDEFEVISAYPNPIQSELTIQFAAPNSGEVEFNLIDVLGRSLYQSKTQAKKGLNEANLNDVSNLPQGTYLLTVKYGAFRSVVRLVK